LEGSDSLTGQHDRQSGHQPRAVAEELRNRERPAVAEHCPGDDGEKADRCAGPGQQHRGVPLCRERGVEKDRLEYFPINYQEREPEQEPSRPARERARHFLADIALPLISLCLAMHPDSDREQDHGREQRPKSFRQFPARAADPDCIGGNRPGKPARNERSDPATMHITHGFRPLRFAEERDHGDHDQESFQPFAQQDCEGS